MSTGAMDMQENAATILIVDDEVHILHVLSLKLRNAGYHVLTAEDGEEAFDAARRLKPALVITDYQMPYVNGLELCVRLRNHEPTANIPCIMLTARGYSLAQEQMEQTNIVAVISKPFSPREILARTQELIGAGTSAVAEPGRPEP